jgi:coenzyme F420-0:L-glutamate ligase / coenzyme F420-1:gamma-L-glutamate ligase
MATREIHAFAVPGLPEIQAGDDLGTVIADAVVRAGIIVQNGDVFVVAQKIVSKAEGATVALNGVTPSPAAVHWAAQHHKDAAAVEVVFRESKRIVRMERGITISETHHGFVCANAGVDASNVAPGTVTLLPRDPDGSAQRLRTALAVRFGASVAVIVADSFGRPWREGIVNVAIGVAGLRPLDDCRGRPDSFGRRLQTTVVAVADEIAGAAELVMGKTAHLPVVIVRGASEWAGEGSGAALVRPAELDLFR